MNFVTKLAIAVVSAFSCVQLFAFGPGGSFPSGGPSGGAFTGGGSFSYDTVIASLTTNSDASVSRDGVVVGCVSSASAFSPSSDVSAVVDGAFAGNTSLTSVDLSSSSITEVPSDCFAGCTSLLTVVLPSSVTKIGPSAFAGCSALVSTTGSGLTEIGDDAFRDCVSMTTAPDTNGVSVGTCAFANCPGLSPSSEVSGDSSDDVTYTIVFHRNDSSAEKTEEREFEYGVNTRLPSLSSLGWARRGFEFKGWATSAENAASGKIWKYDWGIVATPTGAGESMDAYAVWGLKDGYYALKFIRNDGAGTWWTIGFPYGTKTRIPSMTSGLGWARRGYSFMGWEVTTENANDNTRESAWKEDWAYVSTPVEAGETLLVYARWKLKDGCYEIRFNKNDGSGTWRTLGFQVDKWTKLSTISALGWEMDGSKMVGWGSNKSNAEAGVVWKEDGAWVKNAISEGKTLSIYAIWESTSAASAAKGETVALYSAPAQAAPATTASPEVDEPASVYLSGVFSDGSGSYCIMLDEALCGYAFVVRDGESYSIECVAEELGDAYLVTLEDGTVYLVSPDGTAVPLNIPSRPN